MPQDVITYEYWVQAAHPFKRFMDEQGFKWIPEPHNRSPIYNDSFVHQTQVGLGFALRIGQLPEHLDTYSLALASFDPRVPQYKRLPSELLHIIHCPPSDGHMMKSVENLVGSEWIQNMVRSQIRAAELYQVV